jgi:hypothetical protein
MNGDALIEKPKQGSIIYLPKLGDKRDECIDAIYQYVISVRQ